jgi:hypothetical protein
MLEWTGPKPHYRPVGVWVEDGASLVVALTVPVESASSAREIAAAMHHVDVIPEGFLEFHSDRLPPQLGDRGPIFDTDRYKTVQDCAAAVVEHIRKSWDNAERRWTTDVHVLT